MQIGFKEERTVMGHKRTAFTLVELLVVISIIALLLSILMPALGKARMQSKKIVCASYLKTWGLAFQLYGQDNKQLYPAWWVSEPYRQKYIVDMVKQYTPKNLKIVSCPVLSIPLPQSVFDPNNINTAYFTQYCYWGGISQQSAGAWWSGITKDMKNIGLIKISDKPKEVVMCDKSFDKQYSSYIAASNWNHKYAKKFLGNNNLYGDTHVEHVDFSKLRRFQVSSSYIMMR